METMAALKQRLKRWLGGGDADDRTPPGCALSQISLSQEELSEEDDMVKTDEDKQMILTVLYENPAFADLTNQQRLDLVDAFVPVRVKEGDILFRQGDYGHFFYIMDGGECETYVQKLDQPAFRVATVHRGASFGELALMYTGYRRATLVATTDARLWALDRDTFADVVNKSGSELKRIFEKYSVLCETGEPVPQRYMTLDGFIAAFTQHRDKDASVPNADQEAENARLRVLFKMVDRDQTGMITFAEFAMFTHIMANPDPEFEIAFRYFDRAANGAVSKAEFVDALLANSSSIADESRGEEDNNFLNFNCDVMERFFGPGEGNRSLTFPEFAEFFIAFQTEYAQQLFMKFDPGKTGRISYDTFMRIVPRMGDVRAPVYAPHFVECLPDPRYVSYAEFVAFQKFLTHLPAIERVLRATFKRFPLATIKKNTFRALVRAHAVTTFSPLEAAICFQVFGTQRYTIINRESFSQSATSLPMSVQIITRGDGSIDIDEKLLGASAGQRVRDSRMLMTTREIVSNAALGFVAAGLGAAVVFPLDAIKTRMQHSRSAPQVQGIYVYKSSFDCLRHIIKEQGGVRTLYRGLTPVLVGVTPEKFTKIFVNDHLRRIFGDESKGDIFLPLEMLAGAGAGAAQTFITTPMECLKIHMQLQTEPQPWRGGKPVEVVAPRGMVAYVRELGLTGMYRGLGPTLLRDTLFSAIYFPAYVALKAMVTDPHSGHLTPQGLLFAGGVAAMPAALLTTPLDVIKTRIQATRMSTGDWKVNKELKYRSIADCVRKSVRHEGWRSLWKGAGLRLLLWPPQFAVSLFAYESLQRHLFPDIIPVPPTHVPVNSRDFMALRTERLQERLHKVEGELRMLQLEQQPGPQGSGSQGKGGWA